MFQLRVKFNNGHNLLVWHQSLSVSQMVELACRSDLLLLWVELKLDLSKHRTSGNVKGSGALILQNDKPVVACDVSSLTVLMHLPAKEASLEEMVDKRIVNILMIMESRCQRIDGLDVSGVGLGGNKKIDYVQNFNSPYLLFDCCRNGTD